VQVDPIKRTLKARGTQRLKLESVELLSNLAFKFNLRRYIEGAVADAAEHCAGVMHGDVGSGCQILRATSSASH